MDPLRHGSIIDAEGDFSLNFESLDIVDYSTGLPAESATLYYHTSDDEMRRIFPADPNGLSDTCHF